MPGDPFSVLFCYRRRTRAAVDVGDQAAGRDIRVMDGGEKADRAAAFS